MNKLLKLVLFSAILVNLVGVFGPEVGFDALWYHLTEPKIWLMWGRIDFIPGGLFYYSAMPRLGEFIYYLGRANDTFAHFINYLAGIGTAIIVYKIGGKKNGLLASVIFYCNPLVGWQSGSAYVDLIRTFFESLALFFLLRKKYVFSGLAVGLAVGVKTLALGSLGILGILGKSGKLVIVGILVSCPWFLFAYAKTGYPFYPIGAGILSEGHNIGNFLPLIPLDWWLFIYYLSLFWWNRKGLLFKYALLAFIVWFITPRTGETRFLLPYLPAFAVLTAEVIEKYKKFTVLLLIPVFSVIYRGVANSRLVPYLTGKETKIQYLRKHVDSSTYIEGDVDSVKNYHNLYYVNFPFRVP